MNEYKRLHKLYPITFTTLLMTAVVMVLSVYITIFVAIMNYKINQCTSENCFGIHLKSLIPDYSGQINQLQEVTKEQVEKLSTQLVVIQQQLTQLQQFAAGIGRRD